jgi:hypothetical protein
MHRDDLSRDQMRVRRGRDEERDFCATARSGRAPSAINRWGMGLQSYAQLETTALEQGAASSFRDQFGHFARLLCGAQWPSQSLTRAGRAVREITALSPSSRPVEN